MRLNMKISVLHFIGLLLLGVVLQADALERRYKYVVSTMLVSQHTSLS